MSSTAIVLAVALSGAAATPPPPPGAASVEADAPEGGEEQSALPLHPAAVFGIQAGSGAASAVVTFPLQFVFALASTAFFPGSAQLGIQGGGEDAILPWATAFGLGALGVAVTGLVGAGVVWLGTWLADYDDVPWWSLGTTTLLTLVGGVAIVVTAGQAKADTNHNVDEGNITFEDNATRLLGPMAVTSGIVSLGVPLVTSAVFAVETGALE